MLGGQNPVKYKNWETIGEYLKKNDFNGARNAFGDLQLIDALYHFGLGLGDTYNITSDVFVQARYTLGLTKIFKDEDPIKNGNAQIAIGYRF